MYLQNLKLTNDPSFVKIHIESSIDITIQNILTNQTNCNSEDLQMLCPNGCSGNGVCIFGKFFYISKKLNQVVKNLIWAHFKNVL